MSAGTLIAPLSISGSTTNTGTPNAGGSFYAYLPGTTTQTTIYSDAAATIAVTQPVTLDNAGRVPYATYPNGLYCTGPIRLYIVASDGTTVLSDTVYQTVAGGAALANADFPNESTVDAAFTAVGTSVGGIDGKYQAPSGTTPRTIQAVLSSLQLTPEDFGAKGDGLNDDTSAIQAMINALAAASGGIGRFAPTGGNFYKITAAVTFPLNATGITLVGAGDLATTIKQTTTADVFATTTTASDIVFSNMTITGNVALTGVLKGGMRNVIVTRGTSTSAYGILASGCSNLVFEELQAGGVTTGSEIISLANSSNVYFTRCILGTSFVSATCIDVSGSSGGLYCYGTQFIGATGVKFESGASGTGFYFTDCPTLGTLAPPFDTSAISDVDRGIYQRNCGMDYNLTDNITATGQTLNPNPLYGTAAFRFTAGGGSTALVGTPAPNPANGTLKGKRFSTYFVNASGGTVGVTFAAGAGQFITAVFVPNANGTRMHHSWEWDGSDWILLSSGQAA